ncbi:hypothetical protein BgAZ_107220 [Babesia gibsoni]|uniref:Uncharacterized protein n=1 Tax=Babesia gibsoni TaxID=33632 RepID=A0AAD8PG90_BABGI|nr:hypothetical protein BgAZ_107220 [Babesia gibsoni]
MQQFIAALRAAKPAQLPQLGLRLANSLAGPRPPPQFWHEYVRKIGDEMTYTRLSPHSKCLVTCVACRLDSDVARTSQAHQLVKRVLKDTMVPRSLSLLNMELINMLLVACYKLNLSISSQQLSDVLDRIHALVRHTNHFKVEFTVSLLHSLGSICRAYPKLREHISSSDVIRVIVEAFPALSKEMNTRELSLAIFSFDKMNIMDSKLSSAVLKAVSDKRDRLQGQDLATILLSCSSHKSTIHVLDVLRENVNSSCMDLTGREACNLCCAYIKAGRWDESQFPMLEHALPKMNAQEICNVVNLVIRHNVSLTTSFKDAYINFINNSISRLTLSLIDALTMTQSLSSWGLRSRINMFQLDTAIRSCVERDRSFPCSKHVYLLHYCFLLECHQAATAISKRIVPALNEMQLSNKEMVVLYNSMRNLGVYDHSVLRLEKALKRRLSQGQSFSDIDMHTLAHWGDVEIKSHIAKRILAYDCNPTLIKVKLIRSVVEDVQTDEILDLVSKVIHIVLVDKCSDGAELASHMEKAIGTCELLPLMQGRVDGVSIFNGFLDKCSQQNLLDGLDVKLMISLLSVARKLNLQSHTLNMIADLAAERLGDDIPPSSCLEYLNAVYHLEIDVARVDNVINCAKTVATRTRDIRMVDATALSLSALCLSGFLNPVELSGLIEYRLKVSSSDSCMMRKALFMYLSSHGTLTSTMYNRISTITNRTIKESSSFGPSNKSASARNQQQTEAGFYDDSPDDHNQIQSSVYSTLDKIFSNDTDKTMLSVEAPLSLDYIADILVTKT